MTIINKKKIVFFLVLCANKQFPQIVSYQIESKTPFDKLIQEVLYSFSAFILVLPLLF